MQRLSQMLTEAGLGNQDKNQTPRNQEDRTLRVDVPDFEGQSLKPEDYIDWETSLERFFEYRDTPMNKQYKMAKVKLTKLATVWLEGVQRQRLREGKPKIDTWEKLKKNLRRKYVPANYKQQLSLQWNTLTQGNRTVASFIQEWERLAVLCDIGDSEDMRVGKFLAGLREDLRLKIALKPNLTVTMAGNHALMLEQHTKKKPAPLAGHTFNRGNSTPYPRNNSQSTYTKTNPSSESKGKIVTPNKDIVCFKCHRVGHYRSACNRAFTVVEWNEINERERPKTILVNINGKEEERGPLTTPEDPNGTYVQKDTGEVVLYTTDSEEEYEREQLQPEVDTHHTLVIRRSFHTTPRAHKSDQRENIFQTKCRIKDKVCDLIIDGGSETNCVSQNLVQELKLTTQTHHQPYKLKWLDNKASGSVHRQSLITFTIGSYHDQVLCDVLDMDACHVLLGRP